MTDSGKLGRNDPRYRATVEKRFNKRFIANPDYVRLVGSTEGIVAAVSDAVKDGKRFVATSGGHRRSASRGQRQAEEAAENCGTGWMDVRHAGPRGQRGG